MGSETAWTKPTDHSRYRLLDRSITRRRQSAGYTVAELLLSLMLFSLLSVGVLLFVTSFKTAMKQNESRMALTHHARLVVEKMTWGYTPVGMVEKQGIWKATQLQPIVDPAELQYVTEGITRTIRQNGQNIEYVVPGNPPFILFSPTEVTPDPTDVFVDLEFDAVNADVVQIRLVLGRQILGRWHYASLSTQVAIRNS